MKPPEEIFCFKPEIWTEFNDEKMDVAVNGGINLQLMSACKCRIEMTDLLIGRQIFSLSRF